MAEPAVFDGRNIYEPHHMAERGFRLLRHRPQRLTRLRRRSEKSRRLSAIGATFWTPGADSEYLSSFVFPHALWRFPHVRDRPFACDQHPSFPRRGCRGEGGQRPPRHADGRGAHGLRALDPVPEVRPLGPRLAGPRPLRALGRPRLHAPLRAAPPGGLRPLAWTTSATSASGAPPRPATRNTATPPAWRRPPGPLGQGFGDAVGMAIAERRLAARFNQPGFELVDHCTYAIVGDG